MSIDQQIREILSRNCPVNDNMITPDHRPHTLTGSVSVVGNHNIIVSSDLLLLGLFLIINTCCLLYFILE